MTFRASIPLLLLPILAGCTNLRGSTVDGKTALQTGDVVIRNVAVVDVVGRRVRPDQEIIVRGGRIAAIRPAGSRSFGARAVDGQGMIALPGFVNTHTHLWQHVARGFYPSGNLQEWVRIYRYAHYFTRQEIHDAVRAAASQALLSGVTTLADFASSDFSEFSVEATCEALRETGLDGGVVWWNPAVFLPAQIKRQEIERIRKSCGEGLDLWMGPGPLSFFPLPAIYDGIVLARQLGLRLTEHTMENVQEQRDLHQSLTAYLDEHGHSLSRADYETVRASLERGPPSAVDEMTELRRRSQRLLASPSADRLTPQERRGLRGLSAGETISPVPLLEYLGMLGGFLAIHSVWPNLSDMDAYQRQGVAVSHNPESNQYLSSGISPVLELLDRGVVVSLGTDGAASNDGIDFFSAMRGLWNLQKLSYLDTSLTRRLDAWTVLRAATLDGAEALGLAGRTGSLEVGKEADIVLLDTRRLGLAPLMTTEKLDNAAAVIVYSAGPRDVDTVLSNGRILVSGGQLVGNAEGDLARRLTEISGLLVERQAAGKEWVEEYEVDSRQIGAYLARFRSVRLRDRVQLRVTNVGASPITVTLMMSGTTFGGVVPAALDPEVLDRFPATAPKRFWRQSVTLEAGQALTFSKAQDVSLYRLVTPRGVLEEAGAKSQQLMILVRP